MSKPFVGSVMESCIGGKIVHAGLGSDTYKQLATIAAACGVDIDSIGSGPRKKLLEASERLCDARRLLEGVGVEEARRALVALLIKHRS